MTAIDCSAVIKEFNYNAMSVDVNCGINGKNGVRVLIYDFKDTASFRTEILQAVSEHICCEDIIAIHMKVNEGVNVYLSSFDHVCTIMKTGLKVRSERYEVIHMYSAFTAYNVPPTLNNEEIIKHLEDYASVKEVETLPFCANVPRFSHVIGSERRILVENDGVNNCVLIPRDLTFIVSNVTYRIIIDSYCLLCEKEGHATNMCELKWTGSTKNGTDGADNCMDNESPIYIPDDVFVELPFEKSANPPVLEAVSRMNSSTPVVPVNNKSKEHEVDKPDPYSSDSSDSFSSNLPQINKAFSNCDNNIEDRSSDSITFGSKADQYESLTISNEVLKLIRKRGRPKKPDLENHAKSSRKDSSDVSK